MSSHQYINILIECSNFLLCVNAVSCPILPETFGEDFRLNAREEPCLYAIPMPHYDRGRRQSCLHCEPDLDSQSSSCASGRTAVSLYIHFFSFFYFFFNGPLPFYALRTVVILTHGWTCFAWHRSHNKGEKSVGRRRGIRCIWHVRFNCSERNRSVKTMSRKKAVKGKGSSRSPKASPSSGRDGGRTGKSLAAAAAPSSGLVYPSRPSLSNSGEFYDIAFKVSWEFKP